MHQLPRMTCRKCGSLNPFCYFAPVPVAQGESICVCEPCARKSGFLDRDGNLKPGYSL